MLTTYKRNCTIKEILIGWKKHVINLANIVVLLIMSYAKQIYKKHACRDQQKLQKSKQIRRAAESSSMTNVNSSLQLTIGDSLRLMDECKSSHERTIQHAPEFTHPLQEELLCCIPHSPEHNIPVKLTFKYLWYLLLLI
jgi:hypothetical protein